MSNPNEDYGSWARMSPCEWYVRGSWTKWASTHKVDFPSSLTYTNWTPILEWYVVRCGSMNGYWKDSCFIEIGLHARNMYTILGSIVNIFGVDLYDHLMSTRIFTLIINKILIGAPKNMRNGLQPHFGFANYLLLIICFIWHHEKWASWRSDHLRPIYLRSPMMVSFYISALDVYVISIY